MIIPEKKTADEAMENPKPAKEDVEEKSSTMPDASPKDDDDDDAASSGGSSAEASTGAGVPVDTTISLSTGTTVLPTAWVQHQKEKRKAERASAGSKDQRAIFTPEPVSLVHMLRQLFRRSLTSLLVLLLSKDGHIARKRPEASRTSWQCPFS